MGTAYGQHLNFSKLRWARPKGSASYIRKGINEHKIWKKKNGIEDPPSMYEDEDLFLSLFL